MKLSSFCLLYNIMIIDTDELATAWQSSMCVQWLEPCVICVACDGN